MWAEKSVFYQFYPLGMCGAPSENDGITVPRIKRIIDWIPHLKKLNIDAVYFSPIFESDKHGYDTRDYRKIDCRLGNNEDFAQVCRQLKENSIKIVLDGVFNHTGRGFWAFQDVIKNRENSRYKDWFHISFNGNSGFNDGFYYEGWEGYYELVKLNLKNPEVCEYLFDSIRMWVKELDIDGLRLDVAYCVDEEFLRKLRSFCDSLKPDFVLIGEILSGDYRRIVNKDMLHSCTNYECYKGLYSSFNDLNLFEISYSLNRLFGAEGAGIYKGTHLLAFADNHDVTRVASILKDKKHLALLYGLMFAMPGIPCIYYGSEWGIEGRKEKYSDAALRPEIASPEFNELSKLIAKLASLHKEEKALIYGDYKAVLLTNRQLVFRREYEDECMWIAINADSNNYRVNFNGMQIRGEARDLLSGEKAALADGAELAPYSMYYWKFD